METTKVQPGKRKTTTRFNTLSLGMVSSAYVLPRQGAVEHSMPGMSSNIQQEGVTNDHILDSRSRLRIYEQSYTQSCLRF